MPLSAQAIIEANTRTKTIVTRSVMKSAADCGMRSSSHCCSGQTSASTSSAKVSGAKIELA